VVARIIGAKLGELWGQTVVVDNRAGATGTIGADIVAKSPPDGYTLIMGHVNSHGIAPNLFKKLPYDAQRDFAMVAYVGYVPNVLVVNPSIPAKNVKELIAIAKSRPGQLNYASSGIGSTQHLAGEMFKLSTGVNIVHIPYKGGGPAMVATMGGQTQIIFGTTIGLLPHVRSGKLKAIALTSAKRSAAAPEILTFAESGVPGYEHEPWNGMFAPAKMPKAVVAKLNAEVARILQTPEVRKVFEHEGAEPVGNSSEEFAGIVKSETAKWAKLVKAAGIKPE
jgi:tripartite-type tricarboxylate transporter receptor subunit TctC